MIKFVLRGAPISDEERKTLNLKAGKLFESLGIDMFDYNVRKDFYVGYVGYANYYVGYANYYLFQCWNKTDLKNEADVAVYKQLLEIDAKLGTTQTQQLLSCLYYYPRKDLIEV